MKKIKVIYHHNLETGEVQILVDYESPGYTRLADHEEEHWNYVQELLENSGLLSGVYTVRMRRGDGVISIYRLTKIEEDTRWQWELQTEYPDP